MIKKYLVSLLVFLLQLNAHSALFGSSSDDLLIGPEFTFTNEALISKEQHLSMDAPSFDSYLTYKEEVKEHWKNRIKEKCPECRNLPGSDKFSLPHGNYFEIHPDPMVLEVTVSPMTIKEYETQADFLQDLIFNSAAEVGLTPHIRLGGGHIHFDVISHFKRDPLLIRNFVVDMFNHSEMFLGPLNLDLLNAPPLGLLTPTQQNTFVRAIQFFDLGKYNLAEFIMVLRRDVYIESFLMQYSHTRENPDKYQLLNFNHWPRTLEIRGFRPQENIQHFIRNAKMIEKRIAYLDTLTKPLPIDFKNYQNKVRWGTKEFIEYYTVDVPTEEAVAIYKDYVQGSGLDWKLYKKDMKTSTYTFGHPKPLCRWVLL